MKKIAIILVFLFLKEAQFFCQTIPMPFVVPPGFNNTSGATQQNENSVILGTGGYNVSAAGQSIVEGVEYIQVLPGYEAKQFTSGYSWLRVNPDIPHIASFHPNGFSNIQKYERFEIGVALSDLIQNQINDYLVAGVNGVNRINPYDRDQIRVECIFTWLAGSSPQFTRHAFYKASDITPNTGTPDNWTVTPGAPYPFRIRFAPPYTGNWRARVKVFLNNQPAPNPIAFDFDFSVTNSNNPGHLRMANSSNPNVLKMQFESGPLFYGVGRNITDAKHGTLDTCGLPWHEVKSSPNTHSQHRRAIADLGNNGGNFVRIRLNRWGVPIEEAPPCSVIGINQIPDVKYLTNYSENEKYMWEMDSTLALCEAKRMYILLTLLYDPDFKMTGDGDWRKNPYSALLISLLGEGAKRDDFFTHPTAINTFKNRLYYIEARWGYSTSIAAWEMINETENMQNNGTRLIPDSSPWDATTAGKVSVWLDSMKNYLKSSAIYPKHLVTNVGVNLPPGYADTLDHHSINWTPPSNTSLDFLVDHCYISEMGGVPNTGFGTCIHGPSALTPIKISNYYTHYWPGPLPGNITSPKKGNLIGEFGLADQNPLWIYHRFSALTFHNQNWGSIFSNGISVSLQLFFESIENPNDYGPTTTPSFINPFHKQYNAIRKFTDRIDFNTRLLPDINFSNAPWRNNYTSDNDDQSNVNTFWMKTSGNDTIYGWTQNATANFMADGWDAAVHNANLMSYMSTQCSYVVVSGIPVPTPNPPLANVSNSSKLTILHGLSPNKPYYIRFFDTWDPAGNELTNLNTVVVSDASGMLRFGLNMNYLPPQTTPADTYPDYAFIATTPHIFGWRSSGNDSTDNNVVNIDVDTLNSNVATTFHGPITDTNTINTTNNSEKNKIAGINYAEQPVDLEDRIYPVPASNQLYLILSARWRAPEVIVINELGVETKKPIYSDYSIDVKELANGFYTLRVRDAYHEKMFKFVVQH